MVRCVSPSHVGILSLLASPSYRHSDSNNYGRYQSKYGVRVVGRTRAFPFTGSESHPGRDSDRQSAGSLGSLDLFRVAERWRPTTVCLRSPTHDSRHAVAHFLIQLIYAGVKVDDDATLDALAQAGVATAEGLEDCLARLTAGVEAPDAVNAATLVMDALKEYLPDAEPVKADRDLVSITDISERIGVTREAVRNWTSGKRGPGGFPQPDGSPSDYKVWEWSAVHAWLRHHMGIWDGFDMPNHVEYGQIDNETYLRAKAQAAGNVGDPAPSWTMVSHETLIFSPVDWSVGPATNENWHKPAEPEAKLVRRDLVAA